MSSQFVAVATVLVTCALMLWALVIMDTTIRILIESNKKQIEGLRILNDMVHALQKQLDGVYEMMGLEVTEEGVKSRDQKTH